MKKLPKTFMPLLELAREAFRNAYCPYSGCQVGAVIKTATGSLYAGCNVENASFGATVCAERCAVQNAVSAEGPGTRVTEILILTAQDPPWAPCGICRQVLLEFAQSPSLPVYCATPDGRARMFRLKELLPESFGPKQLQ